MGFSKAYLYLLLINTIFLLFVSANNQTSTTADSKNQIVFNVGVILDFNSSGGVVANSCMAMAISDFYSQNPHYIRRLALHHKNSNGILTAASSALELVNEDQVDAIIGPQFFEEAKFVAEIGNKSQVPIISFSVTSSSLWSMQTPYFIQTTLPYFSQLKAIASLVKQLGWQAIVVLYQDDTDEASGDGFIPTLTDILQQTMQTRVYLVHVTSPDLASRLFPLANEVGLMSNEAAWIITDALSDSLSSLDATTIESMLGVLGVKPYVPKSEYTENFKLRWNEYMLMQLQPIYAETIRSCFNKFCLRAYDTIWALATAVEKIQLPEVKRSYEKLNASCAAITNLRISEVGPRLVKEILETRFLGLSGKFNLKHRQLETAAFEIINIVGNGDRTVGYWTPGRGFSRKIAEDDHGVVYSERVDGVLKPIIWPGDSTEKPKGWDVPGMGLKLRVGVPKKTDFTEFVDVEEIEHTKKLYSVTGFSIDVFKAALDSLPFKLEPEYIPFVNDSGGSNGTINDLVNKLHGTETLDYEAVVGDITIRADREANVDFSLPYTESGVVMVVKAETNKLKDMWIFLKPLSWDLWLAIVLAAIFTGLVLRVLERRLNLHCQLGMLILFPIAALAFPERNMVGNKWARFVLVVWLFMAYILLQSYTANLSSILTVSQLRPSAEKPACAGYQEGSFVEEMLINMNIKCFGYTSMEKYDEALSLGCKNGGVDAIFDEIPYIKLFLRKYGSKYKMAGATYSTGGFGFAFPTGSPLLKPISEAILKVMERGKIQEIEKRYFGKGYITQYQDEDVSQDDSKLTSYSFAGLFTITAFLTLFALVCSECSFAISRYHNRSVDSISRVHSIEATRDLFRESDQQESKEEVEILGQEAESHRQQVLQEHKKMNIHHGEGEKVPSAPANTS